jgi:hypothetical protein
MRNFLFYLTLFLVAGCSSSKNLSYEALMEGAPGWVRQTPNQPGYYHGVGMATKAGTPDAYREVARQNALSELASGISVNISASSVLSQYEFNNEYSEYYRDNIQLSTEQYLEGYELVENWENPQQYWVYYRLSKSKFEQIKQGRIDKAVASSKSDFMKAREFANAGNSPEAMRFYVKSMEEIKDFLGEDLETEIDGKSQGYSTLLFSEMVSALQTIRIVFPKEKIIYTRGAGTKDESMLISVVDENDQQIKNAPVDLRFSFSPGKVKSETTNSNGQARVKIPEFDSKKREEYISASINVEKMVKESTDDPMIRRMLEGLNIPEYVLPIEMISPKFYLEISEQNLGSELKSSIVKREFRNLLERDGLVVSTSPDDADFVIRSTASTEKGTEARGRFTTTLNCSFKLENAAGQVQWSDDAGEITGLGSDYEAAGNDAYKSLQSKIRINIYPSMYQAVFGEVR